MNNGSSFSLQITNIGFFAEIIKFFSQKLHFTPHITPFFGILNCFFLFSTNKFAHLIILLYICNTFLSRNYFKNLISSQFIKL